MRRIALTALLLASGTLGCALTTAQAADPLATLQARIIDVGDRLRPSVVHIEAAVRQNTTRNIVTGSGFIMSPDGIIVTNEHVVERAEKVTVILPGRSGRYPAEIVGADKLTDLAVLRIARRAGDAPFPATELGNSDDLRVGQWVIAIGNPYGLDGTVSLGIVSAKGRDLGTEALLNDFIQTDAMIDRGSSGGPLVDLDGRVVGVNSRGQGRGIGFTIPINTAKRVAEDLLGAGIARGYLGIAMQPLSRELATYWRLTDVTGVVVNGIVAGSPAERAGLRVGDILTRFGGETIVAEKDEDIGQLQRLVARTAVGSEVEVQVYRDGAPHALSVQLGVQPKIVPDEEETRYGFAVQEVTEGLFRQHRLAAREGVLVSFVERGSEAAEASMSPGDLIQQIEGEPVTNIASFRAAMDALPPSRPFLVQARRGDDTRFLLVVPRAAEPRAAGGSAARPES